MQVEAKWAQVRGWVQLSRHIPFIKHGLCWGWGRSTGQSWPLYKSGQETKLEIQELIGLGGWYQGAMTIDKAPIVIKAAQPKELIALN